jgi:pyruvate dehydrogenase E2 component (dihydrolipoamide acetyltransferase)
MLVDVVLPNLGFGMEEGRLIGWLKQIGEAVRKGEAIAEVESDKAAVELQAAVDGVLNELLYQPDQVIPVGAVLARIQVGAPEPRATPLAKRVAEATGVSLTEVHGTGFGGKITRGDVETRRTIPARPLAAPAVRKLARDQGIDLSLIAPTGTYGQITRADLDAYRQTLMAVAAPSPVENVLESAPVIAPPAEPIDMNPDRTEIPLTTMRQAIARRLVQSAQEAPHFYATAELDLTDLLRAAPQEIGITNLLLFATVQTLKSHPELNATFENGRLYRYTPVNLAIAVALPAGLITPVLHHADDFSVAGLASRTRDLIMRARENRLRPEELGGGTFTVSNLGIIKQIDHFTAIINPPQVGILAVGVAKPRPVAIDQGLHIRTTAHLTLSVDHRVVDGLGAGRFLEALDGHLTTLAKSFAKER